MINPGIHLTKIWFDAEMIELKINVSDGISFFSNKVYVGNQTLDHLIARLEAFKSQVSGGLLDIRFGEFGPEYANGAFHGRFHFPRTNKLHITCRMESDYGVFAKKRVASEAVLYLRSEPALLDRFVAELRALNAKECDDAHLEGI